MTRPIFYIYAVRMFFRIVYRKFSHDVRISPKVAWKLAKQIWLSCLLLLSLSASAQDKPVSGEVGTIPLVRFRFERSSKTHTGTDTIPALITAHHKIRPKSVTFYGYVVRNGKRSEYYDECWQKMPGSWVMTKIEKQ